MAINHGTSSGYHSHRRLNQEPCDACREAINAYIRRYRATKGKDRTRTLDKIRRRALAKLRDNHREEYEQLIEECRVEFEVEDQLS